MENKISLLRRQKGIKQYNLARSLNVSPSHLCKIERGIVEPDDNFIKHCSEFFNENTEFIFSADGHHEGSLRLCNKMSNNLWAARHDRKIKQNKLAELLGCSASYLSRIEKGIQEPNTEFKKKCARILKKKQKELFPENKTD